MEFKGCAQGGTCASDAYPWLWTCNGGFEQNLTWSSSAGQIELGQHGLAGARCLGAKPLGAARAEVESKWVPLARSAVKLDGGGGAALSVPLQHGCAMVRVRPADDA